MEQTFMREKPVLPLLVSLSLPMVVSMLVNALYNIVDSFFIAQISEEAMTALSLVYPVQNFINAVAIGFSVGINSVIAYYLGAGNTRRANAAATWGMLLSAVHGLLLSVVSIAVIPTFLRLFTSDEAVVSRGLRYARIAFAFGIIIALGLAFEKIYQAVGSMKVPMASLMCGCIANIVLDPVLIFGLGPIPAMGIEGAALATGIGQTLTLVVYLVVYRMRAIPVRVSRQHLADGRGLRGKLYAVGIPATLSFALPSLLVSALNAILAGYSQIYVVVLGVYYKLQTFLYLPASGVVQGMRPIIGYNFGAGEHRRVARIYKTALGLCGVVMAAGTVICLAVPGPLIALFTSNPETIAAGQTALRIISAGFLVSTVSVVSSGALEGLSKGMPSLVISLCRYAVIIIPAAYLLSRPWGADGVWHAFWITEAVTALIAYAVYRRSTADVVKPDGGQENKSRCADAE